MAQNKRNEFDEELLPVAELSRALAHPARVAILLKLATCDRCICGELAGSLPLAQSTVSQHLKALKEIGLIRGEIEGPKTCYCLDWDKLNSMSGSLQQFLDQLAGLRKATCC